MAAFPAGFRWGSATSAHQVEGATSVMTGGISNTTRRRRPATRPATASTISTGTPMTSFSWLAWATTPGEALLDAHFAAVAAIGAATESRIGLAVQFADIARTNGEGRQRFT